MQYIQSEDMIYLIYNPKKIASISNYDKIDNQTAQELLDEVNND